MKYVLFGCVAHLLILQTALGQNNHGELEEITVIGTSIISQDERGLLSSTQTANAEDLAKANLNSLADYLDQQLSGITINHAQNNPLQPDVQFRGFSASPLLGTSQGIAIYQNGMRVNETFGDTVNWDLIPDNTISNLSMVTGANPVFGLNALGGALALRTKTGFDDEENQLSIAGGSFSRKMAEFNMGGNDGNFGYHVAAQWFEEDGWRAFSDSEAGNFYTALSWRLEDSSIDLYYNHGDTDLRGNGTAPVEKLADDRKFVFTNPDITANKMDMLNLAYEKSLSESRTFNANVFVRKNDTNSFNGDGSPYGECDDDSGFAGFLCLGDDDDDDGDGDEEEFAEDDDDEVEEEAVALYDYNGNLVDDDFNAINNISARKQKSKGFNLQISDVFTSSSNLRHNLIAGVNYLQGEAEFDSRVEFAELTESLSTTRSGLHDAQGDTNLTSKNKAYGIYLTDTIEVNDRLNMTLSARYDKIDIKSRDRSGKSPELNADHSYSRLNFGASTLYHFNDNLQGYASLGQAMRAPSPVELSCSHPEAPCILPNTFLADPPLDEIVATTFEAGLKGISTASLIDRWHLGLFLAENDNDIMFQSTGGVSSNVGYFENLSDTRRLGLEMRLDGGLSEQAKWSLNYTYLRATFEDSFISSSPNHPFQEDGGVEVRSGSSIPGLPEHNLMLAVDYQFSNAFSVSTTAEYNSGQYLRGDEANLTDKTDDYVVVGLNAEYLVAENFQINLTVQNLFDKDYESFGLFGEPDEVLEGLSDPRFLSAGAPRGTWLKLKYRW